MRTRHLRPTLPSALRNDVPHEALEHAPTLSKTSLAPGETMTLSDISMPVNQTDIDNGGVTNTALAKAQDPLDSSKQIESNLATAQVTLDRVAKLAIEKEASKKTVAIGESFTYTITVTNTGNVALTNVTITDEKLNVHDEVVSTQLAPGASASKTYEAVATQDDAIAGSIYNVASADGTPPTGVTKPQKPTDDETVTVTGSPALTIEKGVTPNTKIMNPVAGETEVTWNFQVTNSGNVTISGISVTDEMLAQRNQTVTLDKTTLNPGESATGSVKMKLTQADINASFVKNVATASGHPVTNPSQSVTTQPSEATVTIGRTAQLALVKTSAITQAAIGDEEVAFTLTATNTGSVTLTNVIVNDPLTGSQNVPVSPSTLNPGESGTVVVKYGPVTQEDAIAGTIHNVATAHGTPPNGVEWPGDPQATKDVPVISTRTLRLEKSVDPEKIDDAKPGDKVTWTLKVTNTGNVTLSNITVTDELLTGRNLPVTLDKTTLTPGESASATVSMEITQADINAGKVVNVAIAHADDPVNQNSTVESNSATAETILPRHADFTVTKMADKQTAKAGDTIKWEITVTNTGHVALRNVRINDELVGLTEKVVAEILEPQKQVTFSVDYVVTEADAKNGQVKNIVTARGDVPSGMDPLDEKEADATVQVTAPPATPTPTPTPTQPTPTPSRPSASNVMSELIQTGIRNPVPTVIGLVSVSATAILVLYKRRKR